MWQRKSKELGQPGAKWGTDGISFSGVQIDKFSWLCDHVSQINVINERLCKYIPMQIKTSFSKLLKSWET